MIKAKLFLSAIFFSSLLGATELPDPRSYVNPEELGQMIAKAVAGSGEHSYWLSSYYLDAISDVHEGEFWLKLSAEQGNCEAIEDYVRFIKSQYRKSVSDFSRDFGDRLSKIKCQSDLD